MQRFVDKYGFRRDPYYDKEWKEKGVQYHLKGFSKQPKFYSRILHVHSPAPITAMDHPEIELFGPVQMALSTYEVSNASEEEKSLFSVNDIVRIVDYFHGTDISPDLGRSLMNRVGKVCGSLSNRMLPVHIRGDISTITPADISTHQDRHNNKVWWVPLDHLERIPVTLTGRNNQNIRTLDTMKPGWIAGIERM